MHFLVALEEHRQAVLGDLDDLAGAQVVGVLVAELLVGEMLERNAVAVAVLPYADRKPPVFIPRRDDGPAVGQSQDQRRPVDLVLRVADPLDEVVLAADVRADQLGRVDGAARHRVELAAVLFEVGAGQFLRVVDDPDERERAGPPRRAHQERLGIGIVDHPDRRRTVHLLEDALELGAEGSVLDVVDLSLKPDLGGERRDTGAPRAEVGVIVGPEEHVREDALLADSTEEPAHLPVR